MPRDWTPLVNDGYHRFMPSIRMTGTAVVEAGVMWHCDERLDRSVWLRMRQAPNGRWEVAALYLSPDERAVTTDDLRRVPIGRIEAVANAPDNAAALAGDSNSYVRPLEEIAAAAAARGDQINQESRQQQRRRRLTLPVPDGRTRYGDDFYQRFAEIYLYLTSEGIAPAPQIAAANKVPATTARRWAKEARRRGFLPPGRTGKAN